MKAGRERESVRERERVRRERGNRTCTDWIKLFQLIQSVSKFANSNFCFFTSCHSNQKKFQNLESKQNRNLLFKPFFQKSNPAKNLFQLEFVSKEFPPRIKNSVEDFFPDAKQNKMRFKAP